MFALLLGVVALALVFAPPEFRKIGLGIVLAVLLVFLAIILANRRPLPATAPSPAERTTGPLPKDQRKFDFDKYERDKKDREDPEAKTRIPTAQVHFDQVQAIAGIEPRTLQSIHARLYNDSTQFTLTDHAYYLVIEDCLRTKPSDASENQCTAVYDQRAWVSMPIPAGQARDTVITIPTFPPPFKLLGTPHVELTPTDTRSYQAKSAG